MLVAKLCLTLCNPDCSAPGSCAWASPAKNTGVGCHSLLQPLLSPEDFPNPGIELGSLALQAGSLPSEPLGKSRQNYNSKDTCAPVFIAALFPTAKIW